MNCSPSRSSTRLGLIAERVTWGTGLVCIVGWTAFYIDGAVARRRYLDRFAVDRVATPPSPRTPDQSLWSPQRVLAWQTAANTPGSRPLAILRIPRLRLEAPVLDGTDDTTLNRGVGHIEETAAPGTDGNSGLAGHRDGYFRGLKDIGPGDEIELETRLATQVYRVERTWIVGPDDVSVLDPTPKRSVTLVTCYPFYFVGSAPQRFIVRAVLADTRSIAVLPAR